MLRRLRAGAATRCPSKAARAVTKAKKPLLVSGGSIWRRYLVHFLESSMPAFGDASHSCRGSGVPASDCESEISNLGRRRETPDSLMGTETTSPGGLQLEGKSPGDHWLAPPVSESTSLTYTGRSSRNDLVPANTPATAHRPSVPPTEGAVSV